jgi:isopentenyl phosphate kinase
MAEKVLLKLGGSVITHKGGDCAADEGRLRTIARAIADHPGLRFVIVHGAGSCGHPEARRYHLDRGLSAATVPGIYETHRAVSTLNDAVVQALRGEGIEAIGMHPLHAATSRAGRIESFETGPIQLMLLRGIVPVLHGDVVMDHERGAAIVSGDQLVACLARTLGITRVGLATDVAGVLDNGHVVLRIDAARAEALALGPSGHTDVTGGMKGKIDELMGLAEAGIESHIFHVTRISDFLAGKMHGGSTVCRKA